MAAFNAGDIVAELKLDRDPFQAGLRAARREGEDFERRHYRATLDAEDRPAQRKLGGLYADMRRIARERAVPRVDVDVSGVAALTGVRRQIAMLPERHTTVVDIDTRWGMGAVSSLLGKIGSFKVTAVASLVALVPAAVGAATAVGGIGVAALGVLAPLGVLGVAMAAAFKRGGPEIKAFKQELRGLKMAFADVTGPGAMEGFRGLTDMFKSLQTAISGLRPSFTVLGKAAGDAFRSMGRQLASDRFRVFYAQMTGAATKAVPLLTRSLKALLDIFRNLATAGAPLFLKALRGLAGALRDIATRTSDIDKMRASMQSGAGVMGKLWEIAKNLAGVFKALFDAASTGSNSFLDAMERATAGLSKFLASKDGQDILKKTLASVALFVEEIARSLPALIRAFGKLLDIVRPIYRVMVDLFELLGKLPGGSAISAIGLGFLAWKGPIGTAKLLLDGLVGTLGKLIQKAGRKIMVRMGVSTAGTAVAEGVAGAAGGAAGQRAATRGAGAAAATAGGAAGGSFLARFMGRLRGLPGQIANLFRRLGPRVLPALAGVGTALVGVFSKALPKIGSALGRLGPMLARLLPRVLAGVAATVATGGVALAVAIVAAIAATIWSLLPKKAKDAIWGAIKGAGKWVWGAIKTGAGAIKDAGTFIAKGVAQGVKAAAKLVWNAAKNLGERAWKLIKGMAGKYLAAGKAVIGAVAKGVKGAAKTVIGAAKDLATRAWKAIRGMAGKFTAAGKAVIGAVVKGVKAVASKVVGAAKSLTSNAWKAIKGFAGSFFDAGKAIIAKLIDGIRSMAGAAKDAVASVVGGARDLLPFSEPRDRSSPLYGLGRSGEMIIDNLARGVAKGRGSLRRQMLAAAEAAYAPIRSAARAQLAQMDALDRARAPKPLSRAQQEGEIIGRINQARDAVDERGVRMDARPPGVARVASQEERELEAELAELRRGFYREDLERAATVNVRTMIPSDPRTMREVQRGLGRSFRQGRRRRPRARRAV